MDISDHININKVIDQLKTKDREITHLRVIEKNFNDSLHKAEEITSQVENRW